MARGKPKTKTGTLSIRIEPHVKAAAELAAKREMRSLTSFVEYLIVSYCRGIGIQPETTNIKEKNQ